MEKSIESFEKQYKDTFGGYQKYINEFLQRAGYCTTKEPHEKTSTKFIEFETDIIRSGIEAKSNR